MKVLITGKNGQVGSCLVSQLSNAPSIDFLALGRDELDITNAEQVNEVVNKYQPTVIINAAAYTAVDQAEFDYELASAVNSIGPRNLAQAASNVNAVIIHISTDYVFSGDKVGLYRETDQVDPQGVYGQSKLTGEQNVARECAAHFIIRTAWVFSEYGNNFVKTMIRLAKTQKIINVVGDQFGGPTYAGDVAETIITIANSAYHGNSEFGIYHYTGAPQVSWYQFAVEIFDQALKEKVIKKSIQLNEIDTKDFPTKAKRPSNSSLDCRKICDVFSVKPSNWKKALKNTHHYYMD